MPADNGKIVKLLGVYITIIICKLKDGEGKSPDRDGVQVDGGRMAED